MSRPAIFLDRDGTICHDPGYLADPKALRLLPQVGKALSLLQRRGFHLIVVSNQSAIARGFLTEAQLEVIHQRLRERLQRQGVRLRGIYYCPHHPEEGYPPYRRRCDCRKPQGGLVRRAAAEHQIALSRSYVIGDQATDIALARRMGMKAILVLTGDGRRHLEEGVKPDYVAPNLLAAARWILKRRPP